MPRFCPGCGKAVNDDTTAFCPGCGRGLKEIPATGTSGPSQPVTASPGPRNAGKRPRSTRRLAILIGGILIVFVLCAGCAAFILPGLTRAAPGPAGAGYTGYVPFTSADDHFTIMVPQSWYVSEDAVADHPSFFLNNVSVPGATLVQQNNVISISSPDANLHTIITGLDYTIPGNAGITDSALISGFLDGSIAGVERSLLSPVQYYAQNPACVGQRYTDFVPTTFDVTKDPGTTSINGMAVGHATLLPKNSKGQALNDLEISVIRGKNAVYFVQNSYSPDETNDTAAVTQLQTMLESFKETT
jgi:hypothetical protein